MPQLLFVQNELMRIGVDPQRGAGIAWLSRPNSNTNLLNEYDVGRFIQQSYYGKEDGSKWNGNPWRWNPVQAGSWTNKPAKVIRCSPDKPGCLVTEVNPRNWAGEQLLEDVFMRSEIQLPPGARHCHVQFTMRYTGGDTHPVRIQELPAVFLNRKLGQLVFYSGGEPWKGKPVTNKWPGFPNENFRIDENWAAYIDPSTGEGVGVYTPVAQTITAYRVGADGSSATSDCSYFAPTMRFAIKPGMTLVYHTFIAMGNVDFLRKEFGSIRSWSSANKPELLQAPAMAGATAAI